MKAASWLFASLVVAIAAPLAVAAEFENWNPRERAVFDLINLQRGHRDLAPLFADSRLHEVASAHSADMLARDFFSHVNPDETPATSRVTASGYRWNQTGENIAIGAGRISDFAGFREAPAVDAAREVMYGTDDLTKLRDFAISRGRGTANGYTWEDVGDGWLNIEWVAWASENGGAGGWMGSTEHRENVFSTRYSDVGVGYAFSADDPGDFRFNTYWTQTFAGGDSGGDPGPGPDPGPGGGPGGRSPALVPTVILPMLDDTP